MTRALAYQTMNTAWKAVEWDKTGFERVVFTDGYEYSWTYDLRKLKTPDNDQRERPAENIQPDLKE